MASGILNGEPSPRFQLPYRDSINSSPATEVSLRKVPERNTMHDPDQVIGPSGTRQFQGSPGDFMPHQEVHQGVGETVQGLSGQQVLQEFVVLEGQRLALFAGDEIPLLDLLPQSRRVGHAGRQQLRLDSQHVADGLPGMQVAFLVFAGNVDFQLPQARQCDGGESQQGARQFHLVDGSAPLRRLADPQGTVRRVVPDGGMHQADLLDGPDALSHGIQAARLHDIQDEPQRLRGPPAEVAGQLAGAVQDLGPALAAAIQDGQGHGHQHQAEHRPLAGEQFLGAAHLRHIRPGRQAAPLVEEGVQDGRRVSVRPIHVADHVGQGRVRLRDASGTDEGGDDLIGRGIPDSVHEVQEGGITVRIGRALGHGTSQ
jgi:hypothetical protein